MTEENYKYRTDPLFLRNQFSHAGKYGIPTIPKIEFSREELHDLRLISFDQTKRDGGKHSDRAVHFFLYDYKFKKLWENPEPFLDQLKPYRAVLSPDFSMYTEMPPAVLLYNTFRNRWCGAYLAGKGLCVIPTVNWGNEDSFDFCFEGIPKGSIVAVSTYMASEHNNHADQKEYFLKGYEEMLRRIEPETILCYHKPFPEMKGNIMTIPYDSSSWQSLKEQKDFESADKPAIMVTKVGYVTNQWQEKGSGSAYGGKWRPNPNKQSDLILQGPPNTIQKVFIQTKKVGYWVLVKYGNDGWAVKIRHFTDHGWPKYHTNPHDMIIEYDPNNGTPYYGNHPDINYWPEEYPDGAPEFKSFAGGVNIVKTVENEYDSDTFRFHTISEFKSCVARGAEINFEWKNREYHICPVWSNGNRAFCLVSLESFEEKAFENADQILECNLDGDRLRDIITQVAVIDRTL